MRDHTELSTFELAVEVAIMLYKVNKGFGPFN